MRKVKAGNERGAKGRNAGLNTGQERSWKHR